MTAARRFFLGAAAWVETSRPAAMPATPSLLGRHQARPGDQFAVSGQERWWSGPGQIWRGRVRSGLRRSGSAGLRGARQNTALRERRHRIRGVGQTIPASRRGP
jgi:hypothetical protein